MVRSFMDYTIDNNLKMNNPWEGAAFGVHANPSEMSDQERKKRVKLPPGEQDAYFQFKVHCYNSYEFQVFQV